MNTELPPAQVPAPGSPPPPTPGSSPPPTPKRSLAVPVTVVATLAIVTALLFGATRIAPTRADRGGAATPAVSAPAADGTAAPEGASGDFTAQAPVAELLAMIRRDDGDPVALGEVDAPVVLVEYSDYQCPYCARFARDTEPVLIKEYVDKGILRIEWRDFPYLGQESHLAAQAGRAAAKQGRFWEYHEQLMANQQRANQGLVTPQFLAGLASAAGLDTQAFASDFLAEDVAQDVERDLREGRGIGVNGTPSFIINGRPLVGAQPLDVFRAAIDASAEEAGVRR